MTGRIVFLNPNMKDELGSIDLLGLGFKVEQLDALVRAKDHETTTLSSGQNDG